jgi:Nitroreductase family.
MRKLLALPLLFLSFYSIAQDNIKLPQPQAEGGMPLMDALRLRESSRSFSEDTLSLQTISNLLWAANGINRPTGKHTAPSSMNYQEIDIYVALRGGLYLYDTKENLLQLVNSGDFMEATGTQDFVKHAPLNLVYVANYNRVPKVTEYQQNASWANAAFIAQNVYLYCASTNLGCVVRASYNTEVLPKVLKLGANQKIIFTQTVGKKR